MIEQRHLAALLDPAVACACTAKQIRGAVDQLAEIEAQIERLSELAEEIEPVLASGRKRRCRSPRFNAWEMAMASAGAALDRLVGEGAPQ